MHLIVRFIFQCMTQVAEHCITDRISSCSAQHQISKSLQVTASHRAWRFARYTCARKHVSFRLHWRVSIGLHCLPVQQLGQRWHHKEDSAKKCLLLLHKLHFTSNWGVSRDEGRRNCKTWLIYYFTASSNALIQH
jgi:hypothetical protein